MFNMPGLEPMSQVQVRLDTSDFSAMVNIALVAKVAPTRLIGCWQTHRTLLAPEQLPSSQQDSNSGPSHYHLNQRHLIQKARSCPSLHSHFRGRLKKQLSLTWCCFWQRSGQKRFRRCWRVAEGRGGQEPSTRKVKVKISNPAQMRIFVEQRTFADKLGQGPENVRC